MILKKTSILTALILIFTLGSCKKKSTHNFENKIIGEWKYVREKDKPNKDGHIPPPPPSGNQRLGYEFNNDGTFEYKFGFFKSIKDDQNNLSKLIYLGTTSNYKIDNDTLKLYDISEKKWDSYKIVDIKSDTLKIIDTSGDVIKFHKSIYKIDNSITYDKLIVSSTGCYGTCPVNDIEININGEIIYYGGSYSSIEGYYKSKISKKDYSKINLSFLKANWKNLNDEYIANKTDSETIYVTFIKDGKIIKTIEDYGKESPTEFIWAYTPVRFLHQKIKLEQVIPKNDILEARYISFKTKNKICPITKSETFYLKNLLSKSKEVNSNFEEKYTIEYSSNDLKKNIKTDGRYYKIEKNKGKFITLDLGYDFLKQNDLNQRFRDTTEYD